MGKYDFDLDVYGDNTIAWIADAVEKNSRVLEFGPANGRLTKFLKEQKDCRVDIVEIDLKSGKDAEKYAVNALIGSDKGNIEKYYWMDLGEKYDYIIFADVLEHLVNPDQVINHCNAVIQKGGKILVSVPNVSHNSIIIELFNDRFNYTPTGLLDNTHLRFFTRQSFERMVLDAGWVIVGERAKYIRVGESEIENSYKDVSKEVFKELAHRENGDVYQYFFTLALCDDYLTGNCERTVSLDSTSYYFAEVYFEHDSVFDYKKSTNRHYDPHNGYVEMSFHNFDCARKVLFKPLNANCVLQDIYIEAKTDKESFVIEEYKTNGSKIGDFYYFVKNAPEIEILLPQNTIDIGVKFSVLKYDFEDKVFDEVFSRLQTEMRHIVQICEDYEKELLNRQNEYDSRIREYKEKTDSLSEFKVLLRSFKEKFNRLHRITKKQIVTLEDRSKENNIDVEKIRKITAVIPNYNYARYLVERIDSILFQTYPVKELIILDDCSTDNSLEVIDKYISEHQTNIPITVISNEKNSGNVFAQWQKAFEVANSDYVWIAEADDSCNAYFLETVMKGFEDPEVVLSYCESLTIDENNVLLMGDLRVWIDIFNTGKWNDNYINDGKKEVQETMCINNTIANVSSAVIKNGDYFDILESAKDYRLAGDWYVYMNILRRGKIAYFKESLNYHRMQKQGLTLSTSHEKEFEEIVRLQDYAMYHFDVPEEVKTKVYERREKERVRFGL